MARAHGAIQTGVAQTASRRMSVGVGPLLARMFRTEPLRRVSLRRGDWLYIASVFIVTRAMIVFVGILATATFPEAAPHQSFVLRPIGGGQSDFFMRLYARFDSGWYLGISHGYLLPSSGRPDWLAEWAFFPLYALILHPVSLVLTALHIPINTDILAGVIVSYVALFVALVYLYRLVAAELSFAAARRSVFYIAIFPASIFFSVVYPESLFLLLGVATFYHGRRRQWLIAGLLAACAALTRPQGLFLLAPLALEFISAWRAQEGGGGGRLKRLNGLWLGLPLVALGGYALYSHAETGYWLAFSASASQAWGHRLTPPIYPLVHFVLAPDLGSAFAYDFSSVNFAVAIIVLALVVVAWLRLPPAYSLWLLIAVLFPLSTNGHYFFSFARYVSTAFPAFIALAAWSLEQRWMPGERASEEGGDEVYAPVKMSLLSLELRDRLVVVPSLLLLTLYTIFFVNGYPPGI